jgi:hypothetical protein
MQLEDGNDIVNNTLFECIETGNGFVHRGSLLSWHAQCLCRRQNAILPFLTTEDATLISWREGDGTVENDKYELGNTVDRKEYKANPKNLDN